MDHDKFRITVNGGKRLDVEVLRLESGGHAGAFKCPDCPRIHFLFESVQVGFAVAGSGHKIPIEGVALTVEEAEALCNAVLTAAGFTPIKINARPGSEVH